MEISIDPTALAAVGILTGVIVQAVKGLSIVKKNPDVIPLLSLLVGGLVGFAASFFTSVEAYQGIIAGILASGGYDLLHSGKNIVKGTGNGQ